MLASTEIENYWTRQLTTTSQYISGYSDISYASRAYIWAMDSATTAYAVLDDGSRVQLGTASMYNNTQIGSTWISIPSNVSARVRGVYVSVKGAGRDSEYGRDRYEGGAKIYGYRRVWR